MEKCPHCEQLTLEEYKESFECRCGYIKYKSQIDTRKEIEKLREEYKTSSLFNPPTNELKEAKRKAWRDWASRNPDKVQAMRERKKEERRRLKQEREGKNNTASILIE